MKRTICNLFLLVVLFNAFAVEAKSIMEQLINKDWHELDLTNLNTRKDYYIKFTGTQRMIVGEDSLGNVKARVQKYYLSDKKTNHFDETQIGKQRNGKYIVVLSGNGEAICYEITKISEDVLNISDLSRNNKQQYFLSETESSSDNESEYAIRGTVITSQELLTGKTWYEIDVKSGKKLRTEMLYDKGGMVLSCVFAENPKRELPEWLMREYYFSDNIETEFKHSKIGDRKNGIYLVVKEKDRNGEWYAANYDISTLSANRLVLDCVYPKGIPSRTFMTREGLEQSDKVRRKPQQWQLTENVWYRLDTATMQRDRVKVRFDDTKMRRSYPTIVDGVRTVREVDCVYYLSNTADTVFEHSKVGNTPEGDYLIVNEPFGNEERRISSYRIDFLDKKNMVLTQNHDSLLTITAYERDRSEEEQEREVAEEAEAKRKRTTLDFLTGRQWRFDKLPNPKMSKWERFYFTDSLYASVNFIYDPINQVWDNRISYYEYYLSESAHQNFSYGELKKKHENGMFICFYKMQPVSVILEEGLQRSRILKIKEKFKRTFAYEIRFLSEYMLIYDTVPIEFDPRATGRVRRGIIYQYKLRCD